METRRQPRLACPLAIRLTQAVHPGPKSRALDIGTGSGYQAAVLAELCKEVYSIEILKPLAENAQKRLAEMGSRV